MYNIIIYSKNNQNMLLKIDHYLVIRLVLTNLCMTAMYHVWYYKFDISSEINKSIDYTIDHHSVSKTSLF